MSQKTNKEMVLNLSCPWLDSPIRTGIFNPRTGKEYILSDYYVDADGNRHFTHPKAIEIGERTPGWQLCTNEFHRALDIVLWDYSKGDWAENVCGTELNGFEYLTKVLKYELGGFRSNGSGALTSVGYYGYSWSSTVSGTNALRLSFHYDGLYPSLAFSRAYGFQVRCLQEE